MTWLTIVGSLAGTLLLGLAGRWAFYALGRKKDEVRALQKRVDDLEHQLKVEKNAPQSPEDFARRLRSGGM